MNSSAITNSIMPTVSVPGANAQESAGSGFGDVMNSITDNWSERNSQIKYSAAKSAQRNWEENRTDQKAAAKSNAPDSHDYSARNDRRDETPRQLDNDSHADVRDEKTEPHKDVTAESSDDQPSDQNAQAGDDRDVTDNKAAPTEETSAEPATAATEDGDTSTNVADANNQDTNAVVPNQVAQAAPAPGSPEALALAIAQAQGQATATGATAKAPGTANNGQPVAGMAANGGAADGTTDGLMSSTALSQPVASTSAKMALNGGNAADSTAEDFASNKFMSRLVDSMSNDGKAKSDTPTNAAGTNANANNSATGNSANTAQQSANANPAQAAQQAMAAAAGAQAQNSPAQPQAGVGPNGNAAVSATTSADGSAQAVNGQTQTASSLNQTSTNGQTAQTARHAPAQQVQQQVAVSIRNAASEGVDKISVQLRPEHLGRVDVKLEIGHDGRVQGVIQADTRETLDMLRQDSRALQQALKDAGLNADSQSFTFEHRNEGGQSQDGNGRSQMAVNQGSSPDDGDVLSGAELAEHVGIGYGINPNGLVDIRI